MKKILIGGSPCTHWSIAQKNNRETTAEGIGWELFKNYLIAKEKFQPDIFLYENNKSAAKAIRNQISVELDMPLQYINSALVSAQSRNRFYAHNIPNVPQPEDRGILLRDILESGVVDKEKAYCLCAQYGKVEYQKWYERKFTDNKNKQQHEYIFEQIPLCITEEGKSQTIKSQYCKNAPSNAFRTGTFGATMIAEPVRIGTIENDAKNQDHDSKQ